MKRCFKCGQDKPLDEFYKHPRMADGHLGKCKACTKRDVGEHRQLHLDEIRAYDRRRAVLPHRRAAVKRVCKAYYEVHPERRSVSGKLCAAVKSGHLVRPETCEVCGAKTHINGHHPDYSQPLVVMWVCQPCHKKLHKMFR